MLAKLTRHNGQQLGHRNRLVPTPVLTNGIIIEALCGPSAGPDCRPCHHLSSQEDFNIQIQILQREFVMRSVRILCKYQIPSISGRFSPFLDDIKNGKYHNVNCSLSVSFIFCVWTEPYNFDTICDDPGSLSGWNAGVQMMLIILQRSPGTDPMLYRSSLALNLRNGIIQAIDSSS